MTQVNPVIDNDWYVGMTVPPLKIPLNTDSGVDDISMLNTSNITVKLRNLNTVPQTDTTGQGTIRILSNKPAIISYQFHVNDVATAGQFELVVIGHFPDSIDGLASAGTAIWDPITINIKDI